LLLTTKRKQTVTLLLKTRRPLNVIHGSARFAKFNKARDISSCTGMMGIAIVARPLAARDARHQAAAYVSGCGFQSVVQAVSVPENLDQGGSLFSAKVLDAVVFRGFIEDRQFFWYGGEAGSKRFNPNNLKQVERWQKEVASVFGVEQEGKKAQRDSRIAQVPLSHGFVLWRLSASAYQAATLPA
jgi:hypothetical protein